MHWRRHVTAHTRLCDRMSTHTLPISGRVSLTGFVHPACTEGFLLKCISGKLASHFLCIDSLPRLRGFLSAWFSSANLLLFLARPTDLPTYFTDRTQPPGWQLHWGLWLGRRCQRLKAVLKLFFISDGQASPQYVYRRSIICGKLKQCPAINAY